MQKFLVLIGEKKLGQYLLVQGLDKTTELRKDLDIFGVFKVFGRLEESGLLERKKLMVEMIGGGDRWLGELLITL